MSRALPIALATALLSGCALNAVLEIDMQLPYAAGTDDGEFAIVQVADEPPDVDRASGLPLWYPAWPEPSDRVTRHAFAISEGENLCDDLDRPCNVRFSVTTENVDLDNLYLKVSFCNTPDCLGAGDATNPGFFGFVIARPFYQGQVTRWSPTRTDVTTFNPDGLDTQPPPLGAMVDPADDPRPYEVPRCHVQGCTDMPAFGIGWCATDPPGSMTPGAHFCED